MRRSLQELVSGALTPSMETIAFQHGAELYTGLVMQIEKIQSKGDYSTAAVRSSKIEEIIFNETGIKVTLEVEDSPHENAGVWTGPLIKNNILSQNYDDPELLKTIDQLSLGNMIKDYKTETMGKIDLTNGKVSGIYSELVFSMFFTSSMLRPKPVDRFSSAEVLAEVLLHELGHVFTFIVYLAYGVRRAMILSQIARIAAGIDNYNDRVHVLTYAADLGGQKIDYNSLGSIAPGDQGVNYQAVLLTESRQQIKAELGLDVYAYRAAEQLADQFVVRQGGGAALAYFLGDRESLGKDVSTYRLIWAQEILFGAQITLSIIGLPILVLFLLFMAEPAEQRYDDPIDRLALIRRELYLRLAEKKLSLKVRQKTLKDIEAIDSMLAGAKRYPGFVNWLSKLKPSIRRYSGQINMQRTLNELGANRAFAVSGMFASMENDTLVPIQQDTTPADKLISVLTRIRTQYRSEQGGSGSLQMEGLARLLQRESEARQQIPAYGRKLLETEPSASSAQPHVILETCRKELERLNVTPSVIQVILSSSDEILSYFYTTGDYLNAMELLKLRKESILTDMVFNAESAIARVGTLERICTAITRAAPELLKAASTVAESGSIACYLDSDSIIQRMTDQLRYICTQASPLDTPTNPDLDDIADAGGGPYPAKIHKLVKSLRYAEVVIQQDSFRGIGQIKDPATAYIETATIARQCLIAIGQQAGEVIDHLSAVPMSDVHSAETALFYTRVSKLLSTLMDIADGGASLMNDIRTMTATIDQAQDFTLNLGQLIYPH